MTSFYAHLLQHEYQATSTRMEQKHKSRAPNINYLAPICHFSLRVRRQLSEFTCTDHDYLPELGEPNFVRHAVGLALGEYMFKTAQDRVLGVQCIGGGGALRVGAQFLRRTLGAHQIYVSQPAWSEYQRIFEGADLTVRKYIYPNKPCGTNTFSFDKMYEDLENADPLSIVLLQASNHNPTGLDPSKKHWTDIMEIIRRRNLFPFFDLAYQGLGGGIEEDAWPVRLFAENNFEIFVAQSFSSNFGIFDESVGHLTVLATDPAHISRLQHHFVNLIQSHWATPSAFGARLVCLVLDDRQLRNEWETALNECRRILDGKKWRLFRQLQQDDDGNIVVPVNTSE